MRDVRGYYRFIKISLDVEGIHRWKDCNIREVYYLQNFHRHIFHIIVEFRVSHNNRDREFIVTKHQIYSFLKNKFYNFELNMFDFGDMSCENIAELILDEFRDAVSCEVWEDKENGARIERRRYDD